jgi:DNA-binding protein H-NS
LAKINLTGLDVEGLLELRKKVDAKIGEHQRALQKQLDKLGLSGGRDSVNNGRRRSTLRGRKVAPKYRSKKDPKLTWAGRGAVPLWMREEMKARKLKKDAFLIK